MDPPRRQDIEAEIRTLSSRIESLQADLDPAPPPPASPDTPSHALLLLSDSALPLGSFAYSHALESYLAHQNKSASLSHFLHLSLSSTAALSVPHILAAYRDPAGLERHTDTYDASVTCNVARRASVNQGRALLSVWEKSFRPARPWKADAAQIALDNFSTALKTNRGGEEVQPHFPSLHGVVCAALDLNAHQTVKIFLLSHVKAVLSAAVRASVVGPYAAQAMLASQEVECAIESEMERNWSTDVAEACQTAPPIDLWAGRHEKLYSRIFNS